jgi:hypothetical protein
VLASLAPMAYDWVRTEVWLSRLERGEDDGAEDALTEPRHAARVLERYLEVDARRPQSDEAKRLAEPLVRLAFGRTLSPGMRQTLFDRRYPFVLECQQIMIPVQPEALVPGFLVHAQGDGVQLVAAAWNLRKATYPCPEPRPHDDVAQYIEYFLSGDDQQSKLVHKRSTWVLFPSAASASRGPQVLATEDLTETPDPIAWFAGRPREVSGPGAMPVIELRFASLGSWRQYIRGMDRIERSAAYAVALDRSAESPPREPYPLGKVALLDVEPSGRWFAESAFTGPIPDMDQGAHWVQFPVPGSEAKLDPVGRIRLIFTPDPEYARANGFEAAADLAPFTREFYLPPWRSPGG